jgi:hypothetical protein
MRVVSGRGGSGPTSPTRRRTPHSASPHRPRCAAAHLANAHGSALPPAPAGPRPSVLARDRRAGSMHTGPTNAPCACAAAARAPERDGGTRRPEAATPWTGRGRSRRRCRGCRDSGNAHTVAKRHEPPVADRPASHVPRQVLRHAATVLVAMKNLHIPIEPAQLVQEPDELLQQKGVGRVGSLLPERPEGCCAQKTPDPIVFGPRFAPWKIHLYSIAPGAALAHEWAA